MKMSCRVAYFSMEIGIHPAVPTYSGGLGVLAGDTLRSAADLCLPMVAVTPVHRKGYFIQELDQNGVQREHPAPWNVEDMLEPLEPRVSIEIEGRRVLLRAWRYTLKGVTGGTVPVFLLDTNMPENDPGDRALTDHLYGGDLRYRLCQEAVLGIGGVRLLRALGYSAIDRFHMNEGHAALLTLELLREQLALRQSCSITAADVEAVRSKCVFTTHTPVPAGHDQFSMHLVEQVLGHQVMNCIPSEAIRDGQLNMTRLALYFSQAANAVAKRHSEVSQRMFPEYRINAITNGVHAATWTSAAFADLFDRWMPGWREDNAHLRFAAGIPDNEIWDAHVQAKRLLIEHVNRMTNAGFDPGVFTMGFARRATTYKRADLLVSDVGRLKAMADRFGPIQIVYADKAHPHDAGGKEMIYRVHQAIAQLQPTVRVVYLANYDMPLARIIIPGVDLWVNTPQRPLEASGTSGMKAALNGVPQLSILDGWWVEGCVENVTGWAIGPDRHAMDDPHDWQRDAADLYDKLERVVLPTFHEQRERWIEIMRMTIAINGAYFNTQRMVQDYAVRAYMC